MWTFSWTGGLAYIVISIMPNYKCKIYKLLKIIQIILACKS